MRIIQRCPEFLPKMFDPWLHDPQRTLLLSHERGLKISAGVAKTYKNQRDHDPSNIHMAREVASLEDPIPVGILYWNPEVPCYEDIRGAGQLHTPEQVRAGLESELDKYTVWPEERAAAPPAA